MECSDGSNGGGAASNASALRWKILRRALLRGTSSNSDKISEVGLKRVSRKATLGFNLIPFQVMDGHSEENSDVQRDVCFCYTLPIQNSPTILQYQRVESRADLNDFEVCKRYNIDNTGIVCQWPSEDVLAYYCLLHANMFRHKRVIELGSGYGLAGLVIALATEALEVVITDGNPQVVDYIQRSIDANSGAFRASKVKSRVLHWNHEKAIDFSNRFDIIVASDCTFFKEFHKDLAQTIRFLLSKVGPSEAILLSPKRGDTLEKFLLEIEDSGLQHNITEIYDSEVWSRHQNFANGDDSWANYEKDHCYPLLVRITWTQDD
ncbi:hypothetical protein M9H77_05294 [Catharanthus roseus]|uniref:Uncharacterized protein n=1 Tax=Catharanthus roseus TaxID=4058 RepID=A0ACC0CGI3_CATRO|nr:hypothetical protein M9H77_05294 [Catharanthus roseus]